MSEAAREPEGLDATWRRHQAAGEAARRQQRWAAAEEQFGDALAAAEAFGAEDERRVESLLALGGLYSGGCFLPEWEGRGEPLLRRALAILERRGPDHPETARCRVLLAQCCAGVGRPPGRPGGAPADPVEAERLLRQALADLQRTAAPDPGLLKSSISQLERLYEQQGRHAEAEGLLREAEALWERLAGPAHPFALEARVQRAQLYQKAGRPGEAEALLLQALADQERAVGANEPWSLGVLQALAEFYRSQRRYAEAEPYLRRQLAISEQPSPNPPTRAHHLLALARNQIAQEQYGEAEQLLQRALALPELQEARNEHQGAAARQLYRTLLKLTGRTGEALAIAAPAGPGPHSPHNQLREIWRQLVVPPPAPEEAPAFVWITALIVGHVREQSAEARWWTTGEAENWYYCAQGGGSSSGGGSQGQREHALPLRLHSPGGPADLEVFAAADGRADVMTACFLPAAPAAPGGRPRIEVQSNARLLGRPDFAEVELRLVNEGDGDARHVCLDPPAPAEDWELLSQRVGGAPLPAPLEIGRIGAGGTGILVLRLCRRAGDAPPDVTVRGTYSDVGGATLAF